MSPPSGYSPWPLDADPDILAAKWEIQTPGTAQVRYLAALNSNGTVGTNLYADIEIREAVILSTKFTTQAERDRMVGYLAWKWGAVAKLPAGHPYKTEPPRI